MYTTEIYLDFLNPDQQREAKFGRGTKSVTATTVRKGDSARIDIEVIEIGGGRSLERTRLSKIAC